MDNKVQLFVPTFRVDECLEEIKKTLTVGWTGLGFKTIEFEDLWKSFTGHKNAHFLNSATAGLHLAIKILKDNYHWTDGDEVISTPLTFVSTNHAILYEGLKVVFADVDATGCLDPQSIKSRISDRTKAVLFVGLGGNTGSIEEIAHLCRERGIKLILDAAHMAGTRLHGKVPGLLADVTVYSYQAVKNLPTADSGMICFEDDHLDKLVRQYAWLGIDKDTFSRTLSGGAYKWYYDVPNLGYKYHGNSVVAAIAIVQLRYLDADNAYRRQICGWYDEMLSSLPLERVEVLEGCESARHLYQILVEDRDQVLLALNAADVFPGVHYRDNTEYSMYENQAGQCPVAASFSDRVLSLPLHLQMTRNDVVKVAGALSKILSHRNNRS